MAGRRRLSRSTSPPRARAGSRRSTCPPAARCARSSSWATRAPRPSPRRAPTRSASRRPAAELPRGVRHAVPAGLGGELDRLVPPVRLHVAERALGRVEGDVQLAFLDPLVEPGGAEDEPPQPVHEGLVGRAHELRPAVVDVLSEPGRGIGDLAVDDEVHEVLGLVLTELTADEPEPARGLLAALAEVAVVEGEAELSVLEHEVVTAVVASASHPVSGPLARRECVCPEASGS